jgi:RNA polymerase sigma factor (sigma-70 family)
MTFPEPLQEIRNASTAATLVLPEREPRTSRGGPTMSAPSLPVPGVLPGAESSDLQLLQDAQAYLRCRAQRFAPAWRLGEAWAQFYRLYDPLIRGFARASRAPWADLDDCVQLAWVELVRRLPCFRYDPRRGRFRSWLYGVVHSRVIDWYRRRANHGAERLTPRVEEALRSHGLGPVAEYERQCQKEAVHQVLAELRRQASERSYQVLHLRWIEGRAVGQIADILGLTPAQVRFRAHRMKDRFHQLFDLHMGRGPRRGRPGRPAAAPHKGLSRNRATNG